MYTSTHRFINGRPNISKFSAFLGGLVRVADLMVLLITGVLGYWLRFSNFDIPLEYRHVLASGVLIAVIVLNGSSLYSSWRGRYILNQLVSFILIWTLIFCLILVYMVVFKLATELSRIWLGIWYISSIVTGVVVRLGVRKWSNTKHRKGQNTLSVIVIGNKDDSKRVIDILSGQRWMGIEVKGWFDSKNRNIVHHGDLYKGTLKNLQLYIETHNVNQVWITLPMSAEEEIREILDLLDYSTADIKFVPNLLGLRLLNNSVEQIAGMPVISLRASPMDGNAYVIKAIEDRVLAMLILIMIAPLMLLIAIGIKLTSPGPVLFKQRRYGLNCQVIKIWKFRSMVLHHENSGMLTQAKIDDPRVTAFGKFLRRTSLDELPQFFNVIQGKMSIVGPRPHAVEHNDQYKSQVQDYMQRHRVKPGITGWAQVNGYRGETDTLDKMIKRVEYDLDYLQNWSLMFDLRIILMTIIRGFIGKNAY
jgi:putative colanic acid biosynthesis UDP-glucose lipid carrier transferase